jgi:hypothetical protein
MMSADGAPSGTGSQPVLGLIGGATVPSAYPFAELLIDPVEDPVGRPVGQAFPETDEPGR